MTQAGERSAEGLQLWTEEPLLWLHGTGHEIRGDASYYFDCRKRRDRHVVLQLTLAGRGFLSDGRSRTALASGQAFLIDIPAAFEYGFDPQSSRPYEHVFIGMRGAAAYRWYERLTGEFGHVLNLGPRSAVEAQMLSIAHAREAGRLPDRYLLSGQLYQLIMTIYSTLREARVGTSPRVARAIELVAEHAMDRQFGIERLAGMLDCSREHLSRLFQQTLGTSPGDYLAQHRLRLAAKQLRQGDDKLDAIARRSGFSGANYLCRVFRKHVGVTPAEFRGRPWMVGP
jgi:AraC-like DNA-binding protein